jgi:hypothetical protein
VRSLVTGLGYDVTGLTDEQVTQGAMQMVQQAGQLLQENQQYQALLAQQAAAGQQPQEPEAPSVAEEEPYWPQGPEWDPSWERQIVPDPDGKLAAADPTILAKYDARNAFLKRTLERLADGGPWEAVQKPYQQDREALKKEVLEEARKQTQEDLQAYRNQQLQQSIILENQDVLYSVNPQTGRPMVNPQTGQPILSPQGQLIAQHIQFLESSGVTDPTAQFQIAMQMAGNGQQVQQPGQQPAPPSGYPPLPQQPTAPPQSPRQMANDQFLAQAAHGPNRDGSLTASQGPQAPAQTAYPSFGQIADYLAQQRGIPMG